MGWSDYTNEDNTKCTTVYNMIHCLQLAYNERAEFAGIAEIAVTPIFASIPFGFCAGFDNYLDTIIPYFGRIIDGEYVAYTVASIYEELEEERIDTRLAAFKGNNRYSHLWFEQVIRVINKLNKIPEIFSVTFSGDSRRSIFYADFYNYWVGDTPQDAVARELANLETRSDLSYILHHTTAWYLMPDLDKYGGDCASTNLIGRVKVNNTSLYGTTIFPLIILTAEKTYPTGIFNAGTSGFIEGNNIIFPGNSFSIDENGYFDLPLIPGESLDNFPTFPTVGHPTCGYTASISKIIITGNFEFAAGN